MKIVPRWRVFVSLHSLPGLRVGHFHGSRQKRKRKCKQLCGKVKQQRRNFVFFFLVLNSIVNGDKRLCAAVSVSAIIFVRFYFKMRNTEWDRRRTTVPQSNSWHIPIFICASEHMLAKPLRMKILRHSYICKTAARNGWPNSCDFPPFSFWNRGTKHNV